MLRELCQILGVRGQWSPETDLWKPGLIATLWQEVPFLQAPKLKTSLVELWLLFYNNLQNMRGGGAVVQQLRLPCMRPIWGCILVPYIVSEPCQEWFPATELEVSLVSQDVARNQTISDIKSIHHSTGAWTTVCGSRDRIWDGNVQELYLLFCEGGHTRRC